MKAAAIEINGSEAFACRDMPDPVCPDDVLMIDVATISLDGGDLLACAMSPLKVVPHVVADGAADAACKRPPTDMPRACA